ACPGRPPHRRGTSRGEPGQSGLSARSRRERSLRRGCSNVPRGTFGGGGPARRKCSTWNIPRRGEFSLKVGRLCQVTILAGRRKRVNHNRAGPPPAPELLFFWSGRFV